MKKPKVSLTSDTNHPPPPPSSQEGALREMRLQSDGQCQRHLPRMRGENMIRTVIIVLLVLLGCTIISLGLVSSVKGPVRLMAHRPSDGSARPSLEATVRNWDLIFEHEEDSPVAFEHKNWRIPGVFRYSVFVLDLRSMATATPPLRTKTLSLRLWVFVVSSFLYPTVAFIRGPYRRYRRRKKGLCLKCGYDLTANTSGICPECGERI